VVVVVDSIHRSVHPTVLRATPLNLIAQVTMMGTPKEKMAAPVVEMLVMVTHRIPVETLTQNRACRLNPLIQVLFRLDFLELRVVKVAQGKIMRAAAEVVRAEQDVAAEQMELHDAQEDRQVVAVWVTHL
jgi:hypothetical protein